VTISFLLALSLGLGSSVRAQTMSVDVEARAFAPGEFFVVAVRDGEDKTPPRGRFGKQDLEFFRAKQPGLWLAFGGIDVEAKPGKEKLSVDVPTPAGTKPWSKDIAVKPKKFKTRTLKVDQNFVTPKKADEDRANAEAAEVKAIYARRTPELFFHEDFVSPIPGAVVSHFGERSVFNGVPKAPHAGADLRAAQGTPIKAPAGGKVVLAKELFYSGNTVILDHGYGIYTLYAHMSRIDVHDGDLVTQGQVLGLVGMTGRVTGPHLHWGLKVGGVDRVDPFSLTALDLSKWIK
jgi:murein DD-endopeptidase MepM/ murein hydrolase activator NlpD